MTEALVYPSRLNAISGEPGGGKTWVALHACAQAIKAGLHVLYIDLEDHPDSVVGRLRTLGCSDDEIRTCFHYVNPAGPFTDRSWDYLERKVLELGIVLIVIDSIGELLSLQGVNQNDDDKVAAIYRAIPRRFANLGPAVLLLDHVPKNNEATPLFAIGSQRKKAAIDGAAFMCETVKPFGVDVPGKIVLRAAKDRSGNFVAGRVAAEINISSEPGGDHLAITVSAPERSPDGKPRRLTGIMGKVSRFLEAEADASASTNKIETNVGVDKNYLRPALDDMVREGWISRYPGQRNAVIYALIHRFDETAVPPCDRNQVPDEVEF